MEIKHCEAGMEIKHCEECRHYRYDREIFLFQNAQPIGIGYCTIGQPLDFAKHIGHRTFGCDNACKAFEPQAEPKFRKGDILANDKKAIYIERIDREYWPCIYRCRSTANGGWSTTEEEIERDYKLLWRKKTDEN